MPQNVMFLSLVRITDYFFPMSSFLVFVYAHVYRYFLHFSPMDSLKVNFALLLEYKNNNF